VDCVAEVDDSADTGTGESWAVAGVRPANPARTSDDIATNALERRNELGCEPINYSLDEA
jgi:hypothetical protein